MVVKNKNSCENRPKHEENTLTVNDTRFLLAATSDIASLPDGYFDALATDVEDWPQVLSMALKHGVFAPMWLAVLALPKSCLPAGIHQEIRSRVMKFAPVAMSRVADLLWVCNLFENENIPVVALKGPALAIDLYGKPDGRDPGDLDFVIDEKDLPRADQILCDAGYERHGPEKFGSEDVFTKVLLRASNDLEYFHPQKPVRLELHWRWHRNPHALAFNWNDVWEKSRKIEILNKSVHSPSVADMWLYLASHGGRHRWFRLKWITDIRRALENDDYLAALPDAVLLAHKRGSSRALAVAVHLAVRLDEIAGIKTRHKIPKEICDDKTALALANRFAREIIPDGNLVLTTTSVWKEIKAEWSLADSVAKRFSLIVHRVIAPSEHDAMTISLPSRCFWGYGILRPVLWAWRQLKR